MRRRGYAAKSAISLILRVFFAHTHTHTHTMNSAAAAAAAAGAAASAGAGGNNGSTGKDNSSSGSSGSSGGSGSGSAPASGGTASVADKLMAVIHTTIKTMKNTYVTKPAKDLQMSVSADLTESLAKVLFGSQGHK